MVYGLWMEDGDSLAGPIVKTGMVPEGNFYLFGETPEEALETANRFRERSLSAIKEELARRASERR